MPILRKYDNARFTFLKAESLCAELADNGFSFDNLILRPAGSFRKSFRSDFTICESGELEGERLEIQVNRDGLYDRLPEGLFHQTRGNSKTSNVQSMVEEHRRFKEEERHARRFFQPLEQEFFRFGMMIEQEERVLNKGLYEGSLEQLFYEFWDISPQLPAHAASAMSRIMPWIARIKGNATLTAKALELILNKKVAVTERQAMTQFDVEGGISLGDVALGADSVCGTGYADFSVSWIFRVEKVGEHEISQFLGEGVYAKVLKRFEDLFLPVEVDAVFEFELSKETVAEATEWWLGYSLTI